MKTIEQAALPASGNRLHLKPGTVRILYRATTLLFSSAMLMDGLAGVMREATGQEVMAHLGYPMYAMFIFGVAKILGALALLQSTSRIVKEWAYAGFTINFVGAFASRAFVGDATGLLIPPLVALAILFITYFLWKKARPHEQPASRVFSHDEPLNPITRW
jgi:hypothetical protein